MHEKSADRHHNPARLTTASNHLRGSLRLWRDFTMIGVCSFYPFGVVIWQDVSNMSCKDGILPLCVAKVIKKLQLSKPLVLYKYYVESTGKCKISKFYERTLFLELKS